MQFKLIKRDVEMQFAEDDTLSLGDLIQDTATKKMWFLHRYRRGSFFMTKVEGRAGDLSSETAEVTEFSTEEIS